VSAHTKGPWRIDRDSRKGYEWNLTIAGPAVDVCFMCHDSTPGNETGEANARLIASAPDLLAAAKMALQFIENGRALGYIRMPDAPDPAHETPGMLRDAIRKAGGR
jgi:hypothetical protein